MFKIRCLRCKSKISRNFEFCPYCGIKIKKERDGLLEEISDMENIFLSSVEEKIPKFFTSGLNITISTCGKNPKIDFKEIGIGGSKIEEGSKKQESFQEIKPKNLWNNCKLPKVEPKSKVRRLSNSVVYEIEVPGVKSIKDVYINKLKNSIEIRAIGKNKQYGKILPISLPIKRYYLNNDKLILELNG